MYSTSTQTGKDFSVSGPFNVQHIPKTRNITPDLDNFQELSNIINSKNDDIKNVSNKTNSIISSLKSASSSTASVNSIVVATHLFTAEYDNELSCSPGDVFKLVDPKITNGWVLAQSLSSGIKGWVPKDSVKILDLNNSKGLPVLNQIQNQNKLSSNSSLKSKIQSQNLNDLKDNKNLSNSSNSSSVTSSISVIEYYSSPLTPCSSEISTSTSPLRIKSKLTNSSNLNNNNNININNNSLNEFSNTYKSIFVHSMYFLESSSTSYWYRIDLEFTQNLNQNLHLCRYYSDLITLDKFLNSQIKAFKLNITLPILPSAFNLNNNDVSFADHLPKIDQYLKELFNIIKIQPRDSLLVSTFIKFCQPSENDFEHYVFLDDDQIMKILKPLSENSKNNDEIELILEDETNINNQSINNQIINKDNNYDDFLFTAPKLATSRSITSLASKTSSNTTLSNSSFKNETIYVKIKIVYKDEFSIIKLAGDDLNFSSLSDAISEKLKGLQRFTLAYRNNNGIFILLRDDNGLKKALLINNRKIIIKVI